MWKSVVDVSKEDYCMADNTGSNYIVQFHEKITSFLSAELNIVSCILEYTVLLEILVLKKF